MKVAATKWEWALIGLILCLPVCVHIVAVARWANLNSPKEKFSTLNGYLGFQRPPQRVAAVFTRDATNYVAYGSMAGSSLAFPSGPPAYVFDATGSLIYYSAAIGDDTEFHQKWPAAAQEDMTSEEVHALKFQVGPANGGQPIRSETNRTSTAAGSRR